MSEISSNGTSNNDWKYTPVDDSSDSSLNQNNLNPAAPAAAAEESYSWSALDTFSNQKSASWYVILGIVTLVCSFVVFLITGDKITTAVFLVCGILIGVYAAKKPKLVEYEMNYYGFRVGDRDYKFGNFKSFSIVQHGDNRSAVLVPLRRFMPYMYINFTKDIEVKITESLANTLPKEASRQDALDKFARRIGF